MTTRQSFALQMLRTKTHYLIYNHNVNATIHMKKTPSRSVILSPSRTRRIGRKVLQADRIARLLKKPEAAPKRTWPLPALKPKTYALTGVMLLIVTLIGIGGSRIYLVQVAAAQKIEIEKQQKIAEFNSKEADACRRKKTEEKAELVGKVTFDELYDYNECTK